MDKIFTAYLLMTMHCLLVHSMCEDRIVTASLGENVEVAIYELCTDYGNLLSSKSNDNNFKWVAGMNYTSHTSYFFDGRYKLSIRQWKTVLELSNVTNEDEGVYLFNCARSTRLTVIRLSVKGSFTNKSQINTAYVRQGSNAVLEVQSRSVENYFFKAAIPYADYNRVNTNESLEVTDCHEESSCFVINNVTKIHEGCYVIGYGTGITDIIELLLYDLNLSIGNNSVKCEDEYDGSNFVIELDQRLNGKIIRQIEGRRGKPLYLSIPPVSYYSYVYFQCTSFLDTNKTAVSSHKTWGYRYPGTPVFAPENRNVYVIEPYTLAIINVLVHSTTQIEALWIEQIQNNSLLPVPIRYFSRSPVSQETYNEETTSVNGHQFFIHFPVTSLNTQIFNLWIQNHAGENVFRFYVEVKGHPVFVMESKNVFRGKIGTNISIEVFVHSYDEINTAWVEEINEGLKNNADIYNLTIRRALKTLCYGQRKFNDCYDISFRLPVITADEKLMNLWVENSVGKSVFKFYVETEDNLPKPAFQNYFLISVVVNVGLLICVSLIGTQYCYQKNRLFAKERNDRTENVHTYNEVETLENRLIDIPPTIRERRRLRSSPTVVQVDNQSRNEYIDIYDDCIETHNDNSILESFQLVAQSSDHSSLYEDICSLCHEFQISSVITGETASVKSISLDESNTINYKSQEENGVAPINVLEITNNVSDKKTIVSVVTIQIVQSKQRDHQIMF